jgi:hypothetical protein
MIANRIPQCAKYGVLLPIAWLLAGCSRAPSVDLMGSFFPGWLVCAIVGAVFATVARVVFLRLRIKVALPVLVFPSLAAIFTFLLWLLFFN